MSKRNIQSNEPHVLIVGAGLAGIAAAVNLKKQLGFENFTIYEKSDGVGGVWKENTYPGCGSDVAAHWYSLSSELNPDWATYYSSQPDIRAYWESVWQRHNLDAHTVLNTEVVIAEWDDEVQVYHITLEDTRTGEQRVEDANVFWWAAGGFLAPFFPEDVPGVRDFHGDVWHSARWRHDVDLKGKRVAVIGNGCSAAQLVPKISEDPAVQVVNFVRSPQWYVPRHQYNYSPFTKWVFRHIPFAMKAYRASIYASAELGYFLAFYGEQSVTQKMARAQAEAYIKMKAPEKYLDFLVPKYPVGCKRVIVDPSYLESLNRPNVELNWTPIQSVVDDGLKLSTGETVPFDVIIFGTGFSLLPPRLKIKGRGGLSMGEFFDRMGGPSAYKGITVPGFPNFYMLLGPNTAGGHASVVFNEEVQIDHALQLIKPVVEGKARSFEIRENVFTRYNNWIQERLARSVWAHCQSYYRLRSSDGRNVAIFPGCVTLFWWIVRKVNFSEYIGVGAERFQRERRIRRVNTIVGALLAAVLVAIGAGRSGWMLPSFALLAVPLGLKSA